MGLLNLHTRKHVGMGRASIAGSFRPAGTGAVTNVQGKGFAVARTSVGLYTLTFNEKMAAIDSVIASARQVAGKAMIVSPGVYNAANKTLELRVAEKGSGFIPLDITSLREIASNDIQDLAAYGGILATDSVPDLYRVNGLTDKALKVEWKTGEVDEVAFPPVPLPPDFDGGAPATVHCLWSKDANTDTAMVVDVQAFSGLGDTEMGGNTAAIAVAADTLFETSVSLTGANVGGHPGMLNLALVPGTHANDVLRLHAAWIEYSGLVDMFADADNVVSFEATIRNTSVNT